MRNSRLLACGAALALTALWAACVVGMLWSSFEVLYLGRTANPKALAAAAYTGGLYAMIGMLRALWRL